MAICKEDPDGEPFIRRGNTHWVERELGVSDCGIYWRETSPAEFGTYQAFGIKEIKL